MTKPNLRKAVDKSLADGWHMCKQLSSGGFFSFPTYDKRIVYNRKQLKKLVDEGFGLDSNIGAIALNILLSL